MRTMRRPTWRVLLIGGAILFQAAATLSSLLVADEPAVSDDREGFPVGRFEPQEPLPDYPERTKLLEWREAGGTAHPVIHREDWQRRRAHIVRHFQRVVGPWPSPLRRVPLDVRVTEERSEGGVVRRRVTFQSDPDDRVTAWLLIPAQLARGDDAGRRSGNGGRDRYGDLADGKEAARAPAVLCLHQTTAVGKDEPAGLGGDPTMKYALELAQRGFVTLAPDYPSLGEHAYDFAPAHGYQSGTLKAVWDNARAVDLLESLPFVAADRIGCIGHSLGGHNAIFSAVFDTRLRVVVSSCGFSSLAKDDVPSWTGPRYMPRLASEFGNDVQRIPFDFPELVATLAPRPFLAIAATRDNDFDVSGVRDVLDAARTVYALHDATERLRGEFPDAPHSFPDDARRKAYEFLEKWLRP